MTHLQKWKKEQGRYTYEDIAYDLFINGTWFVFTDTKVNEIFKGYTVPDEVTIEALQKLTGLSRAQILNEE
jgi:hypothetical protein